MKLIIYSLLWFLCFDERTTMVIKARQRCNKLSTFMALAPPVLSALRHKCWIASVAKFLITHIKPHFCIWLWLCKLSGVKSQFKVVIWIWQTFRFDLVLCILCGWIEWTKLHHHEEWVTKDEEENSFIHQCQHKWHKARWGKTDVQTVV